MARKKTSQQGIERVRRGRHLTDEEAARIEKMREQAQTDFPPAKKQRSPLPASGIAAELRRARKAQGLTWYAVAKRAGIPNPNTVRDVEQGADAKLSNLEAIAKALGLKLEVRGA